MKTLPPSLRAAIDMHSYKAKLAAARATLAGGVTAVAVDQLFPTPAPIAERLIRAARLWEGQRVLEPEAGTAGILRAIVAANVPRLELVAVEIHEGLAAQLCRTFPQVDVIREDFLNVGPETLGGFDRILANPPFHNYQDVAHALHMLPFLNPDGVASILMLDDGQSFRPELAGEDGHGRRAERVQALRQAARAQGRTMSAESLPAGCFRSQGTNIRPVLVTIE
jgi:hypothetical protein